MLYTWSLYAGSCLQDNEDKSANHSRYQYSIAPHLHRSPQKLLGGASRRHRSGRSSPCRRNREIRNRLRARENYPPILFRDRLTADGKYGLQGLHRRYRKRARVVDHQAERAERQRVSGYRHGGAAVGDGAACDRDPGRSCGHGLASGHGVDGCDAGGGEGDGAGADD